MNIIREKILNGNQALSQIISQFLPQLRGKINDANLMWLACELQGFQNTLTYYKNGDPSLPPFRTVAGILRVVNSNAEYAPLNHPFAQRTHFFISSPLSWIEEAIQQQQGDYVLVELPDLTTMFKLPNQIVVCECTKAELSKILYNVRLKFLDLADEVVK